MTVSRRLSLQAAQLSWFAHMLLSTSLHKQLYHIYGPYIVHFTQGVSYNVLHVDLRFDRRLVPEIKAVSVFLYDTIYFPYATRF